MNGDLAIILRLFETALHKLRLHLEDTNQEDLSRTEAPGSSVQPESSGEKSSQQVIKKYNNEDDDGPF